MLADAAQRYEKRRGGSSRRPRAADAVLGPAQHASRRPAGGRLGAGVAGPVPDVLGLREQRPHPLDGRGDHGLALDLHGNLPNRRVTSWLHIDREMQPYGYTIGESPQPPQPPPSAIRPPARVPQRREPRERRGVAGRQRLQRLGPHAARRELEQRRRQRGRAPSGDRAPRRAPNQPRAVPRPGPRRDHGSHARDEIVALGGQTRPRPINRAPAAAASAGSRVATASTRSSGPAATRSADRDRSVGSHTRRAPTTTRRPPSAAAAPARRSAAPAGPADDHDDEPVEVDVRGLTAAPDARPRPARRPALRDHCPASARTAFTNASIGGPTSPAPIWPTPGSRWAMPVLTSGRMPVCTTSRQSIPGGVPRKPSAGIGSCGSRPT